MRNERCRAAPPQPRSGRQSIVLLKEPHYFRGTIRVRCGRCNRGLEEVSIEPWITLLWKSTKAERAFKPLARHVRTKVSKRHISTICLV